MVPLNNTTMYKSYAVMLSMGETIPVKMKSVTVNCCRQLVRINNYPAETDFDLCWGGTPSQAFIMSYVVKLIAAEGTILM